MWSHSLLTPFRCLCTAGVLCCCMFQREISSVRGMSSAHLTVFSQCFVCLQFTFHFHVFFHPNLFSHCLGRCVKLLAISGSCIPCSSSLALLQVKVLISNTDFPLCVNVCGARSETEEELFYSRFINVATPAKIQGVLLHPAVTGCVRLGCHGNTALRACSRSFIRLWTEQCAACRMHMGREKGEKPEELLQVVGEQATFLLLTLTQSLRTRKHKETLALGAGALLPADKIFSWSVVG